MRFLCVSDQIDPLVYSPILKERYEDIDAVFCAGDLPMEYIDYIVTTLNKPTFFIFGNHNLSDFKYYNKHASNTFTISDNDMTHNHGGDYVSNKVLRYKRLFFLDKKSNRTPLLISGVSGSKKYNNGLDQYSEFEMKIQLLKLIPSLILNKIKYGRYCDVFLTHASPRHIHDKEDPCHVGFECFNWFIKKFSPTLFIHGHIHLYDLQTKRVTVKDRTTVINAYSHIVIDLLPNKSENIGDKLELAVSVITDR